MEDSTSINGEDMNIQEEEAGIEPLEIICKEDLIIEIGMAGFKVLMMMLLAMFLLDRD